jgi:hypothetical protein
MSDVSSATDVRSIDVTRVAEEGSTDPIVALQAVESRPHLILRMPRMYEDVSATGISTLDIFTLQHGETRSFASMGVFAALDDLRTPEGQIRRQICSLGQLTYRQRLAFRLEFLLDAMEEEGEAWNETSPESLELSPILGDGLKDQAAAWA